MTIITGIKKEELKKLIRIVDSYAHACELFKSIEEDLNSLHEEHKITTLCFVKELDKNSKFKANIDKEYDNARLKLTELGIL